MNRLRILAINNFYPPNHIGGYEIACHDTVEGLKDRGHSVKILTSTYGVKRPSNDEEIYRWLEADIKWKNKGVIIFMARLLKKELVNQNAFKRLCNIHRPDVIYAWNLTHISVSIIFIAQKMGIPVCYFVGDAWISRWERDRWYSLWNRRFSRLYHRILRKFIKPILKMSGLTLPAGLLDLSHVQFASRHLQESASKAGKVISNVEIINHGIDIDEFPYKKQASNIKRLLYLGQIVSHKGLHVVVEAMNILTKRYKHASSKLTVVGDSIEPEYVKDIQKMIRSYHLQDYIDLVGFVPHNHLPEIYQANDIFIFPTILKEEGFGLVIIEAMSSGLAVVGTAVGGSSEILEDEVNSLLFPLGDANACAAQILRLIRDDKLFERIRQSGRLMAEKKFRFKDMMDKIEDSLYITAGKI